MNFAPEIASEFERWKGLTKDSPQQIKPGCLTVEGLLEVHFTVADHFFNLGEGMGGVGPRDLNLLHSTVFRQHTGYGGVDKYTTDFERCASLFYGVIKNHTFLDGNKRTAVLSLIHQMSLVNRVLDAPESDLELLALRTAAGELHDFRNEFDKHARGPEPEIRFIAHFIRSKTRAMNKKKPIVTYRELDRCLRRFGCSLENPKGGYIDVVGKKTRYILGFIPTGKEKAKVAQIGYPGEHAEVGIRALDTVLNATGLTPENGCDSDVVFKGHEPLPALARKYDKLLRALAKE